MNKSISEILTSLYLFSLLLADATKVNVLFWTFNPLCLILMLICYVSIQTVGIFNIHALFCVSVHILYPFKHNNSYLKWTVQMSLIVWFIVSSSAFTTFIEELNQDELCAIVKCSKQHSLNLLLYIIVVTGTLTIIVCILIAGKVYIALEENNKAWAELQIEHSRSINNFSVILKLTCYIIAQLPLQLCLLNLLVFKLAKLASADHFCRIVFLFVLPVNVVCSSLVSVYRNYM